MTERLWINNNYIPLSKSINPALTKSITDIQQPDKRKSTYSKSTSIPNSKEAALVFGHIFEINLTDLSFNPTVKANIRYEVNGEPILEGYCQLKKITQVDNKDIEYEIVMFGTVANIFRDMGEKYMDDSGMVDELDQWNHPYTKEVQEKSWATEVWDNDAGAFTPFAKGTGYVYPLADYGLSTNLEVFPFQYLPCSVYVKEYIDAIFDSNGYSYTSTFFDSTYFKSLIIPSNPQNNQLTNTEIENLQFTANTPQFTSTGSTTSNAITAGAGFTAVDVIKFTNELTDPAGIYDPTTGSYAPGIAQSGYYDVSALVEITSTFTPSTGASVVTISDIQGALYFYNGSTQLIGVPFFITYGDFHAGGPYSAGARTTAASPTYPSSRIDYIEGTQSIRFSQVLNTGQTVIVERAGDAGDGQSNKYLVTMNNVYLGSTADIRVKWKARYNGLGNDPNKCFVDNFANFYTGTANVNISVGAYYNKALNQYPSEGSTFTIQKAIPKNIKQKDFFMSIVKMFNLWMDVDPDNPKNYLIEPRDDFLNNTVENIQDKLAQDRPFEIVPMGKLDANEFYFSYKQDKDHLNTLYETTWNRMYGDRHVTNDNDFNTKEKKIDVIFSPTVNSAPPNKLRVLPTIIQLDDVGQAKPTASNIRIWYYNGLLPGELWQHTSDQTPPDFHTTYPYAGHWDDPHDPTEDINFGLINEVYYDDNIDPISYTNNNLVNKYYSQMLQTYTAEESKVFTGYFNVSPTDFRSWDFQKLYWFENAYWRLQKIDSFNPTGEELTKCTFLYLTEVPSFIASVDDIIGGFDPITDGLNGGGSNFGEDTPTKGTTTNETDENKTGNRGVDILGESNQVHASAEYVEIRGDENVVNGGTRNIVINGDNNIIEPGVKNVTLINTSGVTIEEDNVTMIDGKVVGGSGAWVTETSDFAPDPTVTGYYADISSNADASCPAGVDGYDWIFKNVGTAILTIKSQTTDTFDGESEIPLDPDESLRIRWNPDEAEYNIIN